MKIMMKKKADNEVFDKLIKACECSMMHPFKKKAKEEPEMPSEEPEEEPESMPSESEESPLDKLSDEEREELLRMYAKIKD